MALNDAYQLLSNDEKKRNFDLFGHPDGPFAAQNERQSETGPNSEFVREFFRQHQHGFQQQYRRGQYRPIPSVTPSLSDADWHAILANSSADVWLVQFYAEGVMASYGNANAWEALASTLGHCVKLARVHHHEFPSLAAEAGVAHVPSIVAVIDRAIFLFEGDASDRFSVAGWLNSLLPDHLHPIRTLADRAAFDAASVDRARVYYFSDQPKQPLTMRWAAFHFRRDIAIALVSRAAMAPAEYASLARTFAVTSAPAIVVHRENDRAQHVSATPQTMREALDKLRYARVPHLVRHRFDALCGAHVERWCIIYVHRDATAGGSRALLADARSNANSAFAQAIGTLEKQQRSSASMRHGAPLIVWLLESEESAFVRSFALPSAHNMIALRIIGNRDEFDAITAPLGELGQLFASLLRTSDELPAGGRRVPLAQLVSLVDDTPLLDVIQWRVRSWYRVVAQAVGMSSLVTTLVILYTLWGICCTRRRVNPQEAAAAAADEAMRATGIMPDGRQWLVEARMYTNNGQRFDSFAQIEGLVRNLKPAVFGPAFPPTGSPSAATMNELHRRQFTFCVVLLERTTFDTPLCAEHYRFLFLKSLQCKAIYHTMFAIAQLNTVDHAEACLLLRTINESNRRSGSAAPSQARSSASEWDGLPKLMGVEIATGRATFFRGESVRSRNCSDWLELLVRGRFKEAATWFDVAEILRDVHNGPMPSPPSQPPQ
jgi:hypothetical protein